MWDLKVLRFAIESATHRVLLGGVTYHPTRNLLNRCVAAWHFNFAPYPGAYDTVLNAEHREMVETGLDLHAEVEQAAVQDLRCSDLPEFPRTWLGFRRNDTVDVELDAPGLQQQAWQQVATWFQARRPEVWPSLPCLGRQDGVGAGRLGRKLRRPGSTWADLVPQLGEDANYLLVELAASTQKEGENGLHLLPLDYFHPASPQKPIQKASRVFLDFEGLLGKQSTDPREEEEVGDERKARLQVVFRGGPEGLEGMSGEVTYDFATVPPHVAHKFIVARPR
jgi:hypothetical protein